MPKRELKHRIRKLERKSDYLDRFVTSWRDRQHVITSLRLTADRSRCEMLTGAEKLYQQADEITLGVLETYLSDFENSEGSTS